MTNGNQNSLDSLNSHDEIDILALFHQLIARKVFIATISIFFALCGVVYSQIPSDEYTASSVVQIEKRAKNLALPSDLIEEMLTSELASSSLETEFHIIRSRLILDQVISDLQLNLSVSPVLPPFLGEAVYRVLGFLEKKSGGESSTFYNWVISLLDPKYVLPNEKIVVKDFFSPSMNVASEIYLEVLSERTFSLTLANKDDVLVTSFGSLGEDVFLGNIVKINVSAIRAHVGAQFLLAIEPNRIVSDKISKNLSIAERGTRNDTGIVDFAFTSKDPAEAVSIVNQVILEYQAQSLGRRSAEIDQSISFINAQLPLANSRLASALKELNQYRTASNSYSDLSIQTQEVLKRIVDLESRLEELRFEKSQLSLQVTQNHPEFLRLIAEEDEVGELLEKMRSSLTEVPETEQMLAQLTKDVQIAQQIQEQLSSSLEQLKIVKASTVGTIRVLESAEVAELSGPNRVKFPLIFLFAGAILSISFVLVKNAIKVGIEDSGAIESLGLSVFATIPLIDGMKSVGAKDPRYILAKSNSGHIAVEAIRGLRTGLHFSLGVQGAKSICLTSSAPNEGKSFTSLNLAIVAAQSNSKVLLVDADMRRGELNKAFGFSRKRQGLASYLMGEKTFEEIVHRSENLGFDFIPNGGYPPNPSELLTSPRFEHLISFANEKYDLIIFDCPPVLAVTDPAIVGAKVGVNLLVVTHLRTTEGEIEACINNMKNAGSKFSGVILNSFDQRKSRYGKNSYRYGYHGGAYRYSYHERRD